MKFLTPLAFGFGLVLPIIVLMYLLKLRRQKVAVSSILLWRKSIEDLQANAPFQKLRNNFLMWLQLLAALLAVLALARPIMKLAGVEGQSYVALIDTSASMKAREMSATRFEIARNELETMIGNLKRGDEMMIVAFDRDSHPVQTFTQDKARLRDAARSIEPRDSGTLLRNPLAYARSLADTRSNLSIVVFSDGGIADFDRVPETLPPLKYVSIGESVENLGIVDLDLRETFDREAEVQLFASVENFGKTAADTILEMKIDGERIDAKEISLEPGDRGAVIFGELQNREGLVELRLNTPDNLMEDNVAYGVLKARGKIRILLVTSGNFFLEKLLSRNEMHEVFIVAPGDYATSGGYDLTVFDNFAPERMEPGSYFMFNALPPMEGFAAGPNALQFPTIIDWSRVHPLTRYVNFDLLHIAKAIDVIAPVWAQTLAEGEISPLVFALERDQRQAVVAAFDLFDTDWMLQASFPIFMSNSVGWLTRMAFSGEAFSYPAGDTIPLTSPGGSKELEIESPSKKTKKLELQDERAAYFGHTDEVGVYHVRDGLEVSKFAVNLLSREESNIAPRETLQLRDQEIASSAETVRSNREIWLWFVLAGLCVLAFEWLIYCKRTWV
jgi:Ca-activated chloride channel family protein